MAERSANTPRPRQSGSSQTARTGNRITVENGNGYGNVPNRTNGRSANQSSSRRNSSSRSDSGRSTERASSRENRGATERTSLGRVNTRSGAADGVRYSSNSTSRSASRSPSDERPSTRTSARSAGSGRSSGRTTSRASGRSASRTSLADRNTRRNSRNDIYVGGPNRSPITPIIIGVVGVAALLALIILFIVPTCSNIFGGNDEAAEVVEVAEPTRVSFVAVGDNLPDDFIGTYADKRAGEEGDKTYDYSAIYEPIKSYIQEADIAYVKEETHIGGNELGPMGYPSFNTTDEMADAIVNAGFDFVASASNHAYDWGLYDALTHSVNLWQTKPVAFTGTAVTEEQYNRIATLERDGITFALLDYTYGVNGFEKEELPEFAVNFIDEERITSDVKRAKEAADVVLVAMHWGTENLTEADDEQKRLAQFLANLDVDVVLGSHPHVIGPVDWVENSNGSGHKTLVAYSLGNFLADHESPNQINVLEGMLTCDFVKQPTETGSGSEDESAKSGSSGSSASSKAASAKADEYTITIENVKWIPLVCHSNAARDDFAIYAVADYPEDVARENRVFTETEDPIAWLNEATADIVSSEFFSYESDSGSGDDGETTT